jgi:hypothetical protein
MDKEENMKRGEDDWYLVERELGHWFRSARGFILII